MPTLPFTRRQLHRTACVTLFAWVFALLSGVVNACQIQPYAPGEPSADLSMAGTSIVRASGHAQPRHVEHAHHDADAEHDGPATDAGKAGCLKFCADESSTVAKGKPAQPDLPSPLAMTNGHWRSATLVATAAPWRSVERPASQGPPLVIRLLRLTI